ncbi:MAG TPA: FmdB family zinc ribbon protein [Steroidobacteraceae bacterium]|nr:FmdB family zinc ribbon protein [Steroidobacteraceae bacterium]
MPLYSYECPEHGVFESLRPLVEYQSPQTCPECDAISMRIITPVALGLMPAATRVAHQRNERAANEPKSSQSAKHGNGCSCCGGGKRNSTTLVAANGNKAFPTKRPWMISH